MVLALNTIVGKEISGTPKGVSTGELTLECQRVATRLLESVAEWVRYTDRHTAFSVGLIKVSRIFHAEWCYQKVRKQTQRVWWGPKR